ncbi:MAG: hypothetical protein ACHREM_08305, partial [Polyangiales bacterium]
MRVRRRGGEAPAIDDIDDKERIGMRSEASVTRGDRRIGLGLRVGVAALVAMLSGCADGSHAQGGANASIDASINASPSFESMAARPVSAALRLDVGDGVARGLAIGGALAFSVRREGASMGSSGAEARTIVSVASVGRGASKLTTATLAMTTSEARVDLSRDHGVVETWLNTSSGLEQQITIDAPIAGEGALSIDLA